MCTPTSRNTLQSSAVRCAQAACARTHNTTSEAHLAPGPTASTRVTVAVLYCRCWPPAARSSTYFTSALTCALSTALSATASRLLQLATVSQQQRQLLHL